MRKRVRPARGWAPSCAFALLGFIVSGAGACATEKTEGGEPTSTATGAAGGQGGASASSTAGSGSGGESTGGQSTGGGGGAGPGGQGGAAAGAGGGGAGGAGGGGEGGAAGAGGAWNGCELPAGTVEHPAETEQNGSASSANTLADGAKGFTAAVCPVGDVDVFSLHVAPAGSGLRVALTDGNGGCPPNAATFVRVLADGVPLASDLDSGPGACSLLEPSQYGALTGLAEGDYLVQVESLSLEPLPAYVLDFEIVPHCGDGTVQLGYDEQCDDGGAVGGDGCSEECKLEMNLVVEKEPNGDSATATSLTGYVGAFASLEPVGDEDFFSFEVTVDGSAVAIWTSDGKGGCPDLFDSKIFLLDAASTELANDDDDGPALCSSISGATDPGAKGLAAGTYYVKVQEVGNDEVQGSYVLEIQVNPPGCGDAALAAPEQCDDGNLTDGDGCSAACKVECPWELEPNDTKPQATALCAGATSWRGSITPATDVDWFSFQVAAGADVTLLTQAVGDPTSCNFDTMLHVVNAAGVEIANDDQTGVGSCSKVSPAANPAMLNLPAGTYYAWVESYGALTTIPKYELVISTQ